MTSFHRVLCPSDIAVIRLSATLKSHVYIYTTPSPQAGCNTRSIFNQGTDGLNTFFFPSRLFGVQRLKSLIYIAEKEMRWTHAFLQGHKCKVKYKQPHPEFELRSQGLFTLITVIQLTHLQINQVCNQRPSSFGSVWPSLFTSLTNIITTNKSCVYARSITFESMCSSLFSSLTHEIIHLKLILRSVER